MVVGPWPWILIRLDRNEWASYFHLGSPIPEPEALPFLLGELRKKMIGSRRG